MYQYIPRAERRRLRRLADTIAALLAASALSAEGARARPITDPAARRLLTRGFAEVIRNDCRPVVRRLTEAEAACLPGFVATPPGAIWLAGFGIDVDGRGTWITRPAWGEGMTEAELADAAEVMVLADLARALNTSGLVREGAQ